ncbi:hypothetical protein C1H46_016239 [Malus baccata]|uniref:Uncharacterized protein n=1 Tax=Malus baccata TaxID=106549 RepID=A0A540MH84_MALBA|nr:hypothetical protein C1H46_016239 [Malus baccata]
MALNLSRGSILPAYPSSEHSLCSSVKYPDGYVMDQFKEIRQVLGVPICKSELGGFVTVLLMILWIDCLSIPLEWRLGLRLRQSLVGFKVLNRMMNLVVLGGMKERQRWLMADCLPV